MQSKPRQKGGTTREGNPSQGKPSQERAKTRQRDAGVVWCRRLVLSVIVFSVVVFPCHVVSRRVVLGHVLLPFILPRLIHGVALGMFWGMLFRKRFCGLLGCAKIEKLVTSWKSWTVFRPPLTQ